MPLESWESSEVRIVGMHYRLVLHRKCGYVGIRYQVRSAADSVENVLQECEMIRSRIKRLDVGVLKPTLHSTQGR